MKLLLVQADSYLTNETKEKIKKDVTNAFRQGFLVYDKGLHVQVVELDDNATTEPLFCDDQKFTTIHEGIQS
ncbi:hypothetical protein ACP2W8_15370 [Bacillus subtilis]|uniref:hypothetical protein n=1 Tax=Bacillus subtilis TaxID=1423 RepID=UPI000EF1DBF7|nr:hypothetical protein [Bacillus subtilis]AYK57033.1 hypothetical protein D9C10_07410 [Bacillus subtilis subsp. subtilis]